MPARIAAGKTATPLPMILLAAVILYVIAWNVTDVKLNRLVERFDDARKVGLSWSTRISSPSIINGEDQVCDWGCL